jgi:hypothetical protein
MGYVFPRYKGFYLRDVEEPSHWSKSKAKTEATPLLATSTSQVE